MRMDDICAFIRECNFDAAETSAILTLSTYGNRSKNDEDMPGEESSNILKEFYFRAPGVPERLVEKLAPRKECVWFREVTIYTDELQIKIDGVSFDVLVRQPQSQEALLGLCAKMLKCKPFAIKINHLA